MKKTIDICVSKVPFTPNMTLRQAVDTFKGLEAYPEIERLLGDAGDPNAPLLGVAANIILIAPPTDLVSTIGFGKVMLEMGVLLGYLMFSPEVDPLPSMPVGLGRDN